MIQNHPHWHSLLRSLLITGVIFASPLSAMAQRIPIADDSLGNERSVVSTDEVINNRLSNRIDGGARRDANLFHSFQEFNIDNGRGVYFTNPDGVANILARVTGGNGSEIFGTLGVLGDADLFLLNPNGILFGRNARLDLQGSFVASTANSFVFDNGFSFSATNLQAPPLLSVNTPIGLQYGSNPGAIQVQQALLQMPNGQTLILAGGAITIDGININGQFLQQRRGLMALGGRVELAGLAAPGEVGLRQQGQAWRLNIPKRLARADVAIDNDAIVEVRSSEGGSIAITAQTLTIRGVGTRVRAGIAEGSGTAGAQAGDIIIDTTEAVSMDESVVNNVVLENGTGNAGDILITTGSLFLLNGATLDASTEGQGNAGNITITARDAVLVDGVNRYGFAGGIFSAVQTIQSIAIGQGGDIHLTTGVLSLSNLGSLSTLTQGQGDAGKITIVARDAVTIDGTSRERFRAVSGIYSLVDYDSSGEGGEINITTGTLALTNGGSIDSSIFGEGTAGDITITATDAVSFEGIDFDGWAGGAFSAVRSEGTGQGGTIRINTGRFSIANGAVLSAAADGEGRAGNLEVNARQLRLENQGAILTETASGQGGDITLQASVLLLRNQSRISTTAGTAQSGGNGGNITFNGDFILAVDTEDSDISANAFTGQGGNVEINVQNLFGIQARPQLTPLSDITASSALGVAGVVAINTADIDPNRGLVQLPVALTDASRLIAQTCPTGDAANRPNEFIITGRGGLPPTPSEAMNRDAIQVELVTASSEEEPSIPQPGRNQLLPSLSPESPIVEAQGFQSMVNGDVMLVAANPHSEMTASPNRLVYCR